jgi:ABC-type amino acid transport substrate-binding protein
MQHSPRIVLAIRRFAGMFARLGLLAAMLGFAPGLLSLAEAAEPLRVCIGDDSPPYAWKTKDGARGFDALMAARLAERLERPLQLFWYDNDYDRESDGIIGVNALLSADLCDLAVGYMLYLPNLGKPTEKVARTPGFRGAKPPRQRPWITLGTLVASRPYHGAAMAVILGPGAGDRVVNSLDDLTGLRLGTVAGSMGGTILRTWREGRYMKQSISLQSHIDPLEGLAAGRFDATMTDIHSLDTWRANHPDKPLRLSNYRHPAIFNMGVVTLSTRQTLLDQVDRALESMLAAGEPQALARQAGMTWIAPGTPAVQSDLSLPRLIEMTAR